MRTSAEYIEQVAVATPLLRLLQLLCCYYCATRLVLVTEGRRVLSTLLRKTLFSAGRQLVTCEDSLQALCRLMSYVKFALPHGIILCCHSILLQVIVQIQNLYVGELDVRNMQPGVLLQPLRNSAGLALFQVLDFTAVLQFGMQHTITTATSNWREACTVRGKPGNDRTHITIVDGNAIRDRQLSYKEDLVIVRTHPPFSFELGTGSGRVST
ncbi:unnamed protein product [Soboliphyme baturini]|uniref:UDENN domain-containing protein n=1 Tax=Soboliphyme baturini TaxID=241478 RepID=A0A183IHP7_9BILA|nr:unnamed protein product [Soboliphyme baturini]